MRRRSTVGALLALLAWLALFLAPVAAQAMTRIDSGLPGAVICSAGKSAQQEGGKATAASHCQACTLAQQVADTRATPETGGVSAETAVPPVGRPADVPPAHAPPRAHPPRAPPLP